MHGWRSTLCCPQLLLFHKWTAIVRACLVQLCEVTCSGGRPLSVLSAALTSCVSRWAVLGWAVCGLGCVLPGRS